MNYIGKLNSIGKQRMFYAMVRQLELLLNRKPTSVALYFYFNALDKP